MKKLLTILIVFAILSSCCLAQSGPHVTQINTFDNIASLRLAHPTTDGTWGVVKGYYAAGDGGGGDFFWDADSTATDDGGMVIDCTGNTGAGRWVRQKTQAKGYSVLWFGLTPGGVIDNTAAFQAMINSVGAKGELIFPDGDFLFSSTVTVPESTSSGHNQQFSISGESTISNHGPSYSTNLIYGGASGTTFLSFPEASNIGITLRDIALSEKNYARGTTGINAASFVLAEFNNVLVQGFLIGVKSTGHSYYSFINKSQFRLCGTGLYVGDSGNANKMAITQSRFWSNDIGAVVNTNDTGVTFSQCYVESNRVGISLTYSQGCTVEDSYFEENSEWDISAYISGTGTQTRPLHALSRNVFVVGGKSNCLEYGDSLATPAGVVTLTDNVFTKNSSATSTAIISFMAAQTPESFIFMGNKYYPTDAYTYGVAANRLSTFSDGLNTNTATLGATRFHTSVGLQTGTGFLLSNNGGTGSNLFTFGSLASGSATTSTYRFFIGGDTNTDNAVKFYSGTTPVFEVSPNKGKVKFVPTSAAPTAEPGVVYFDSDDNKLKVYASGTWVDLH